MNEVSRSSFGAEPPFRATGWWAGALVALALALLVACAGTVDTPVVARATASEVPDLEERALMLLLVDQQLYDPYTAARARELGADMRLELARSLGRAGDAKAIAMLEALLIDDEPEVRREAAFALGLLGDGEGAEALLLGTRDVDRESAGLAVLSLARLEIPLNRVVEALRGLPPEEFWARLAPALFRFPADAALPWVRRALIEGGTASYEHAIYALTRDPQPASLPVFRELLGDPDPWLRGLAARALGRVGDGSDLDRLVALLRDESSTVVVQTLRSARRLVASGAQAPPVAWREPLLALLDDARPAVRLTAVETAGAWLRDAPLGELLAARYAAAAGRERELSLLALAQARHPRAGEFIAEASRSNERSLRRRAAAAAGLLRDLPVLERLTTDDDPAVRSAAYGELLEVLSDGGLATAVRALADDDPVVKAQGFGWARQHPEFPVPDLLAALGAMGPTDLIGAQTAALEALEARAVAVPADRDAVVAALDLLAREAAFPLRDHAGSTLEALGETKPPVGPVASEHGVAVYRDLVRRAWPQRTLRLTTEVGSIDIRLECRVAPLSCINFLQLVGSGFYDGLAFHRVLPDFVAQTGDPRGDGYGGPGYMVRDELSRLRYQRGTVGMASAGRHTAGSQFFVTLSRQPHLDTHYTVLGRVVDGDSVLDDIMQGTLIVSAREIG